MWFKDHSKNRSIKHHVSTGTYFKSLRIAIFWKHYCIRASSTNLGLVVTMNCAMITVAMLRQLPLTDVPHNIRIVESGRGEHGELHPYDTVMLLKRFASDRELSQD